MPLIAALALFSGCLSSRSENGQAVSSNSTSRRANSPAAFASASGKSSALTADHVRKGIEHLRAGNLETASREFAAPLRYDPENSYVRFLNGFTHHLIAERSNPERYEYARIGYELALKFDPNNWLAAQQLGRLSLSLREYSRAQEYFAEALLQRPSDPELLYGLAQASYYLADIETAFGAINKAVALRPDSFEMLAAQAIISAAARQPELAQRSLGRVRALNPGSAHFAKLQSRVGDWAEFHATAFADDGTNRTSSAAAPSDANESRTAAEPAANQPRMAMIDIVMVRTEENETSNKGLNLLENLSVTFAGSYTATRSRSADGTGWAPASRAITGSLTVADVKYSLDILNAGDDRTEVLALPTLIALDGKKSTSFAGQILNVALKGVQAASMSSVESGVALEVQPAFVAEDTLQLHVLARRTAIEDGTVGSFEEAVRTSRNEVDAEVVLKFGQTLVLSGLREKATTGVKSGVPVLRDIPILQYLFANERTTDLHRSMLILLTPRRVSAGMYRTAGATEPSDLRATAAEQATVEAFRKRYGYILEPDPNISRIMSHLDKHRVARGVRSADFFDRPWWGDADSVELILNRASSFLFY